MAASMSGGASGGGGESPVWPPRDGQSGRVLRADESSNRLGWPPRQDASGRFGLDNVGLQPFARDATPGPAGEGSLPELSLTPIGGFRARKGSADMQVKSAFIQATGDDKEPISGIRGCLRVLFASSWVDSFVGCVIVFNFIIVCMETDFRASMYGNVEHHAEPDWVSRSGDACFALYVIEFVLRIIAEGPREYVRNMESGHFIDAFVVVIGIVEYFLSLIEVKAERLGLLHMLHLMRILRMLRVMSLFTFLKELRRLLCMLVDSSRTLISAVLVMLLVMTLWSILLVELVNPVVQDLAASGGWLSCERCHRAYASVFMANLTLFQTVVAGDSWGTFAVPVIEAAPWTATIFMGALLTVVCGVMNIIVAVLVDTFAEGRAKDLLHRAREMDDEEVVEKKVLATIFKKMDKDHSGAVSIPELEEGARKVEDFRNWLRVMDIDCRDLRQLFVMVDEDCSGEIDEHEFVEAMYRMRNAETKTTTKFVKYIVMKMEMEIRNVSAEMLRVEQGLADLIQGVCEMRNGMVPAPSVGEQQAQAASLAKEVMQALGGLQQEEQRIRGTLQAAVDKASEVALEAALQASLKTTEALVEGSLQPSLQAGAEACAPTLYDYKACANDSGSQRTASPRSPRPNVNGQHGGAGSPWSRPGALPIGQAKQVAAQLPGAQLAVTSGPQGRPTGRPEPFSAAVDSQPLPPTLATLRV